MVAIKNRFGSTVLVHLEAMADETIKELLTLFRWGGGMRIVGGGTQDAVQVGRRHEDSGRWHTGRCSGGAAA